MKLVDDCIYEVYGKVRRPLLMVFMVRTIIEYIGTMNTREINAHRTNIESICASEAFKEVNLVKERNF